MSETLSILVHDYVGHPFQFELSRSLARRGHRVQHIYSSSTVTPQGSKAKLPTDPENFDIRPLSLGGMIDRYSFVDRWKQERKYGALLADAIEQRQPDVVISANTPTEAQVRAFNRCQRMEVPFVSWVQDLYGLAAKRILQKKMGVIGSLAGSYLMRLDRRVLKQSNGVVLITEDFMPLMKQWGVPEQRCTTIENWAPLGEVEPRPKDNAWSREHGLHEKPVLIYSGTLAMKHNPELLLRAAQRVKARGAEVVVISEGPGPDWLKTKKTELGIDNLRVMPFQPFNRMSEVLGTADALLAVLEPEAGVFSVPSKVLTYCCSGKPLLLAVPAENLAARIVKRQDAGLLVAPDDLEGFAAAADQLLSDNELRQRQGGNARQYAVENFQIDRITDRFLCVIMNATGRRAPATIAAAANA